MMLHPRNRGSTQPGLYTHDLAQQGPRDLQHRARLRGSPPTPPPRRQPVHALAQMCLIKDKASSFDRDGSGAPQAGLGKALTRRKVTAGNLARSVKEA